MQVQEPRRGAQAGISRRDVLRLGTLGAAGAVMAGCTGPEAGRGGGPVPAPTSPAASGSGTGRATPASAPLTMVTWAGESELTVLRTLADRFRRRTGTEVTVSAIPYEEAVVRLDAQLSGEDPPDVFRVAYPDIGIYAGRNQLLDLAPFLPTGYGSDFAPGLWAALLDGQRVVAVPHHTGTTMLLCNRAALARAGVPELPQRLADAWTWEQFLDVARAVEDQSSKAGTRFAFAVNWQRAGAYRWLNFLSQAGGRLLDAELERPAVPSAESVEALRYTQSFFSEGLVPPTTSTKGQYAEDLFVTGTVAMAFVGDIGLADLQQRIGTTFDYAATFLPRNRSAAADLDGSALVAARTSRRPEQAAQFLAFLVEEESMRTFCTGTGALPTRTDLIGSELDYRTRPDLMRMYAEQATAVPGDLLAQVTVPSFNAVNAVLVEELDRAFTQRPPAEEVLDAMATGITRALG